MDYKVGQTVQTLMRLKDEDGNMLEAGTLLKLVAITPKSFPTAKSTIKAEPYKYDNLPCFFNAVRADLSSLSRIREHFTTIHPIK